MYIGKDQTREKNEYVRKICYFIQQVTEIGLMSRLFINGEFFFIYSDSEFFGVRIFQLKK